MDKHQIVIVIDDDSAVLNSLRFSLELVPALAAV